MMAANLLTIMSLSVWILRLDDGSQLEQAKHQKQRYVRLIFLANFEAQT